MPIKDWPLSERPREKLLSKGAQALSDAELLAICLRQGIKGKSAVDVARATLAHFGSLRSLFNAPYSEFCLLPGFSKTKFAELQAILEINKRYLEQHLERGDLLTNSQMTSQYLSARLRDYAHEVFACLFLDNQHRLIEFVEITHGTIDCAEIYPREVVKQALRYNAAAVIFAHNHPSGKAIASEADRHITEILKTSLALIQVRVLDHLIVGDNEITSFAELGWIN